MARGSVTYTGSFGGKSAGSSGLITDLTGSAIPAGKIITSIYYSLEMSATRYSSSENWQLHGMSIEGSGVEAGGDEISMSSARYTFSGTMSFDRSDISAFGSSTISVWCKANCTGSPTTYMWDISITVNYKDAYETTDSDVPYSVTAGEVLVVGLSNAEISELYHIVKCSIGSYSASVQTAVGATQARIQTNKNWCNAITHSVSGTLTVTVESYETDGTPVDTTTKTTSLSVPADIKPTIGSFSATRISNGVPSAWDNVYVQSISGITIAVAGCAGSYGSTIESYVYGGSVSVISKSASLTINPLNDDGTLTFSVKVVDSRGRESDAKQVSIECLAYQSPKIDGCMAYRCDEDGTSNELGTYIRAFASVSCASCDGKNGYTLKASYQKIGDSAWTVGNSAMTSGEFVLFGGGQVEVTSTYQVKFELNDSFKTVERTVTVSTSQYVLFFRRGGTAIGIGKKANAELEYVIDISEDWTVYHGDINVTEIIRNLANVSIPDIVYSETEPEKVEGRIWLKPKT